MSDEFDLGAVNALKGALAYFGETLADVDDEYWEAPVDEWDVRRVVAHVIINEAQLVALLHGEPVDWTIDVNVSVLGTNAMAAWRGAALNLLSALDEPGALERVYEHPLGEAPGTQLLGMRVVENLAHGWDVAQAIGVDRPIPEHLAEWAMDFLRPMAGAVLDSEHFATAPDLSIGAGPATRFLALLGRSG